MTRRCASRTHTTSAPTRLAAVDSQRKPISWFLLNAEAIVELDTTAVAALRQLVEDLGKRNILFAMARVKRELRQQLVRGELMDVIDRDRIYPTLPVAVAAFERWREQTSTEGTTSPT